MKLLSARVAGWLQGGPTIALGWFSGLWGVLRIGLILVAWLPQLALAADPGRGATLKSFKPSGRALPDGAPQKTLISAQNQGTNNASVIFSGGGMDALDARQMLAVGDTVMFRVLEEQEEAKALPISDAGELQVPELGLVTAVGKTCKELAFEIKAKLEQATYYHATVMISIHLFNKTISGRRVYLAGEVRRAGPQEIPGGETWTVSRAIMGAGGFTDSADKKKVRLVRAGSKNSPGKTYILNIAAVWEKGQTDKDLAVEPEDSIYVPKRPVNF